MCSLAKKSPVAFKADALLFLLHKHLKNEHFPFSVEPKLSGASVS